MQSQILKTYGTLKSAASRLGSKILGTTTELEMGFHKEEGTWYADVKNWPGPKGMLAMVCGADSRLDRRSGHSDFVQLSLSLDCSDEHEILEYVEPHPAGDGAYYRTTLNGWPHMMWLCGVTEFVFGKMPERIGVRVALKEN